MSIKKNKSLLLSFCVSALISSSIVLSTPKDVRAYPSPAAQDEHIGSGAWIADVFDNYPYRHGWARYMSNGR